MQTLSLRVTAGLLAAATLMFSQNTVTPNPNGWRRVGDAPAADPQAQEQAPPPLAQNSGAPGQNPPSYQTPPSYPAQPAYQGGPYQNPPAAGPQQGQYPPYGQAPMARPVAPNAAIPALIDIPAGTFVTVRTNSLISSDKNHVGDAFSGSLARPVVVNGVVVAEPGQIITGQVVEAQKAGRIEGLARLRVQLTELTVVDGQQLPIRSQLINRQASSSVGRDAGAVAGTTGLGAAIGAAAGWGRGAAIGAGAGAAVGVLGVLLTRGQPSVIYPEETLTFRIEAPVSVDTTRSALAFRYVQPGEYNQPVYGQPEAPPPSLLARPVVVAAPYPYPYGYGYPYFYGPGFNFYGGRGWYGHRYGWRR